MSEQIKRMAHAMKVELDKHHEWDDPMTVGPVRGCGHARLADSDFEKMAVVVVPMFDRLFRERFAAEIRAEADRRDEDPSAPDEQPSLPGWFDAADFLEAR